jgi:hypothetical protein
MARALIIAVAVLLGAASVWFLVPTSAATVGGAPSSLPNSKDVASKPAYSGSPMSAEKRRMQAESLVGQNFKYISKDEVFSTSWFTEKGPQAIERAMDECAIITNEELFVQHVMASADSSASDTEEDLDVIAHLQATRPTFKQLRNCVNAKLAYNELFEAQG